jgi:hypothetical protein
MPDAWDLRLSASSAHHFARALRLSSADRVAELDRAAGAGAPERCSRGARVFSREQPEARAVSWGDYRTQCALVLVATVALIVVLR